MSRPPVADHDGAPGSAAFQRLCSWENLALAWRKAARGKRGTASVARFESGPRSTCSTCARGCSPAPIGQAPMCISASRTRSGARSARRGSMTGWCITRYATSSSRGSSVCSFPTATPIVSAGGRIGPSIGCKPSPDAIGTCCAPTSCSFRVGGSRHPARHPSRSDPRTGRHVAGGGDCRRRPRRARRRIPVRSLPGRRPACHLPAARPADRQPHLAVLVQLLSAPVRSVRHPRAAMWSLPSLCG